MTVERRGEEPSPLAMAHQAASAPLGFGLPELGTGPAGARQPGTCLESRPCSGGSSSDSAEALQPAPAQRPCSSVHLRRLTRRSACVQVLSCDVDLLHPTPELEKAKHKLKRLVATPNSYFMDVKCQGCFTM